MSSNSLENTLVTHGNDKDDIIVRLEKSVPQNINGVTKISGLARMHGFIPIIDKLDLTANPRNSKIGSITSAIMESATDNPELFPLLTRGVLVGASKYAKLDRGRVRLGFEDPSIEGILDGGHNTLAIGTMILKQVGVTLPKGTLWDDFKEKWWAHRQEVEEYRRKVRNNADIPSTENVKDLSVYIPVELLVPQDPDDRDCVTAFRSELLEICEARNNNAELPAGAKASKKGYFKEFKDLLLEENPAAYARVAWKPNEGGKVGVDNIAALIWIVFCHLPTVVDDHGKTVNPPRPSVIYSNKRTELKLYQRFMSSPSVTKNDNENYTAHVHNPQVLKAMELAAQIPALADYIYENFPKMYNNAGGKFGSIAAVRHLNESDSAKIAPYDGHAIKTATPDGFVLPLVYALTTLVDQDSMTWKQDPSKFLEGHLQSIVTEYSDVLGPMDYDPQKVGKSSLSYKTAMRAFEFAQLGMLG